MSGYRMAPRSALTTDIAVRDLLIAGMGDSIAAGEGNPDQPIVLDDEGFCFRRFLSVTTSEYFRPGRAGFKGSKACDSTPTPLSEWSALNARWMNAACHRRFTAIRCAPRSRSPSNRPITR